MVDLNATHAAIRAGYSVKTAEAQASRLLRNVDVRNAIQERRAALAEKFHITQENLVEEYKLAEFAQVDDPVTWTEKHKALDSLAKLLGYLVDRKEVDLRVYGRFVIGTGYGEPEEPTVVEGKVVDVDAGGRLESRR